MNEDILAWWNFTTEQYDYRGVPANDDEAAQYIPQIDAAQSLYRLHREMNATILDAMRKVLEAVVR